MNYLKNLIIKLKLEYNLIKKSWDVESSFILCVAIILICILFVNNYIEPIYGIQSPVFSPENMLHEELPDVKVQKLKEAALRHHSNPGRLKEVYLSARNDYERRRVLIQEEYLKCIYNNFFKITDEHSLNSCCGHYIRMFFTAQNAIREQELRNNLYKKQTERNNPYKYNKNYNKKKK